MAPENAVPTCTVCDTPFAEHVEACPACHVPYRRYLQDVDRERQLLTCSRCGAVQDLNASGQGEGEHTLHLMELAEALGATTAASFHPRPLTPRPPGFQLEQDERHTRVSWRTWLERTCIEATREELTVHSRLLSWKRAGPRLKRPELVQLYARRATRIGAVEETYQLCALVRGSSRVILASGFEHPEQVLYLEQLLERQLGIEDERVNGELAPRVPRWHPRPA